MSRSFVGRHRTGRTNLCTQPSYVGQLSDHTVVGGQAVGTLHGCFTGSRSAGKELVIAQEEPKLWVIPPFFRCLAQQLDVSVEIMGMAVGVADAQGEVCEARLKVKGAVKHPGGVIEMPQGSTGITSVEPSGGIALIELFSQNKVPNRFPILAPHERSLAILHRGLVGGIALLGPYRQPGG